MPRTKPSNEPQEVNDESWFYEDRRGITVVSEARDSKGNYLATTQTRLTWGRLLKSASRCGKIAEVR